MIDSVFELNQSNQIQIMSKNEFVVFFSLSLILTFCFAVSAKTIGKSNQYPFVQNEKFVVSALASIYGAQATYQAISTDGNYGSLNELKESGFIDSILASGEKYAYRFTIYKIDRTATVSATFYVTATPRLYRKTGRKSFYIDQTGEVRGADKSGEAATVADPVIDTCFSTNEGCAISDLQVFVGAQATYQSAVGNGNYGTLSQLYTANLINQRMSSGSNHGYNFVCTIIARTNSTPASFKITAVPTIYGTTGIRSFFIDESGVIRGADKNGAPADENDQPIYK